jgi:hypothetical protein
LDKELRFGYQKIGSFMVSFTKEDIKHLEESYVQQVSKSGDKPIVRFGFWRLQS